MKIVLTESQYQKIFESTEYLNMLLDKINDSGIASLSDEEHDALVKISNGADIPPPGESQKYMDDFDGDVEADPLSLFFHYAPEYREIEVEGMNYDVVRNDDDGEVIRVSGEGLELYLIPFAEGDNRIVVDIPGKRSMYMKANSIPKNADEIKVFIDEFYGKYIPTIIKKLINHNNG
jgi:hypothetical protein